MNGSKNSAGSGDPPQQDSSTHSPASAAQVALTAGLIAVSGIASALVLLPRPGSLDWWRRPLADDAYYYLDIARNLTHGRGISTGGHLTNGVQPLYLFVAAMIGSVANWSLTGTPALLTACNWAIYNVAGSWLMTRLWLRLHGERRINRGAVIAVVLWILCANGQRMAFNGMETSLALTAWLAVATVSVPWWEGRRDGRYALGLGLMLGIAFLCRNDTGIAALVIGGWLLMRVVAGREKAARAIASLAIVASVAFACALPWFWFNLSNFGSIMPQSGWAEGMHGLYGGTRQGQLLAAVLSVARLICPVPIGLSRQSAPVALAVSACVFGGFAFAANWAVRQEPKRMQVSLVFLGTACALLSAVYGLLFGAPWVMTRWLAPVLVPAVLVEAAIIDRSLQNSARWMRTAGISALVATGMGRAAILVSDSRIEAQTNTWVLQQYVAREGRENSTIAAFQTGLLSWVYPHVVNLDGKVNPDALHALMEHRFAQWLDSKAFELIVDSDYFGFDTDPSVLKTYVAKPSPKGVIVMEPRKNTDAQR